MKKFGKRKDEPKAMTPIDPPAAGGNVTTAAGKKGSKTQQPATVVKQALQDKAIEYIKSGNIEALEKMTEDGSDEIKFLNRFHTKSGKTPLGVAAEEGRIASVTILLKAKADVNLVDKSGMTAFLYAGSSGEYEILEMLQEADADVHVRATAKDENALLLAASGNHMKCVELLTLFGLAVDDKNKLEETALSIALKFEYYDICSYLVDRQADINVRGVNGNTPLIRTAFDGRTRTAEFIISNGGDVNMANFNGETALMIACRHDHMGVAKLLLDNGANINATDQTGRTALMLCCMVGKHAMVQLLLERGADIHLSCLWGYTALTYACTRSITLSEDAILAHIGTIELLLEKGALVDAMDKNYNTPLMHCCRKGNMRIASLLLEQGADPTLRTMDNVAIADLIASEQDRDLFEMATKVIGGEGGHGQKPGTRPLPEWINQLNRKKAK